MRYAIIIIIHIFILSGCATLPPSAQLEEGNVKRLIERHDFDAARKTAPEWTRDALKTVNYLEARVKTLEVEK